MWEKNYIPRSAFFITLILAICAGTFIAFQVAKNKYYVDVLLGAATLYLIHLLFFPPKKFLDSPITEQIASQEAVKHIAMGFLLSMIVYWSALRLIMSLIYLL